MLAEASHGRRVLLPGPVGRHRERALARGPASGQQQILDGHGHPVERAAGRPLVPARFRGAGILQGSLSIDGDEAVQARVEGIDASQNRFRDLDRRQRLACIEG